MILSPERSALLQTTPADAAPHATSVPVPAWLRRAVADAQTVAGKGIEAIALVAGAAIGALDAVVRHHRLALDRQILEVAIGPAVPTSTLPSTIGTNADLRPDSGNNPAVIKGERDTQYFDPWSR